MVMNTTLKRYLTDIRVSVSGRFLQKSTVRGTHSHADDNSCKNNALEQDWVNFPYKLSIDGFG